MFGHAAARRSGVRALVYLIYLIMGQAAAAAPIELSWSAPPQCPQVEAVRTWLMGHLGEAADPAGYLGVRSRGELKRGGGGWQLRLVIERDGSPGERSLAGRDCEELARSGALALPIALEPALMGATVRAPESTPIVPAPEPIVPRWRPGTAPPSSPSIAAVVPSIDHRTQMLVYFVLHEVS